MFPIAGMVVTKVSLTKRWWGLVMMHYPTLKAKQRIQDSFLLSLNEEIINKGSAKISSDLLDLTTKKALLFVN